MLRVFAVLLVLSFVATLGHESSLASLARGNSALLGAAAPVVVVPEERADGRQLILPAAALTTLLYGAAVTTPIWTTPAGGRKVADPLDPVRTVVLFNGIDEGELKLRRLG